MVLNRRPSFVKKIFITQIWMPFNCCAHASYNDDKGDVIILNAPGNITDELQYE